MKQLAFVQFFSWFALFAMWIYTTPAVTHHIYGATDPSTDLYNKGADWVGVLMAVYNGFAAIMDVVSIPVFLNGGVFTPDDVKRAFQETNADGVMIARGAIDNPWIFRQARELLTTGTIETEIDPFLRINTCLEHLRLAIEIKEEKRGVIEHRKFYTGYLKGLYNASQIRNNLMKITQYSEVENLLLDYLEQLTVRK